MAGLLAANVIAVRAHIFEHVAVADRGSCERQPDGGEKSLQSEIGHDGGHDPRLRETSIFVPGPRNQGHQLIAVDQAAEFVHDQHPVRIAVERDADIGAQFRTLPPGPRGRLSRRRD